MNAGFRRTGWLLFAGALAVRLAYVASIHGGPLFRYLLIDSAFYDEIGRRLATGGSFPEGVFFMNVLYGVFLGVVYQGFGTGEGGRLAAAVIQCGLGAAACVLLARIGAAIGRAREGLVAGAVLAVYGPAVFYDGALLTPSLILFLTTAATLVAVRLLDRTAGVGRTGPAAAASAMDGPVASASAAPKPDRRVLGGALLLGALLGLLILGRANHVLLLAGFGFLLIRQGRSGRMAAGIALVTALLVVLPVTLRNHRESGEIVGVTANGGMALWAGNHPGATGIYSQPMFLANPVPEHEAEDYRAEASRRAGRELTLAESSRWWQRATFRRWASDPMAAAGLFARKARLWFHATESQTNLSYYFAQDLSPVLALLRIHLGWVLPLAVCGLIVEGRRQAVLVLPIAVSVLTCLLFYVSSEYRHPVVPLLLLFGAVGGRTALAILRRGETWRRAGLAAGLVLLLVAVNFRDPFLARLQSRRVDYLNFGTLAAEAGELAEAETLLRRSIAIDPAWSISRRKLAGVLQRMGRAGEAGEEIRLAERLETDGAELPGSLAAAGVLFRARRFPEARAAFLAIAEVGDGRRPGALNNAGLCAMQLGDAAQAESLFVAAREADPTYVSPVVHLGRLALALGDSARAEGYAAEALALEPADGRARRLQARARGEHSEDPGGDENGGEERIPPRR